MTSRAACVGFWFFFFLGSLGLLFACSFSFLFCFSALFCLVAHILWLTLTRLTQIKHLPTFKKEKPEAQQSSCLSWGFCAEWWRKEAHAVALTFFLTNAYHYMMHKSRGGGAKSTERSEGHWEAADQFISESYCPWSSAQRNRSKQTEKESRQTPGCWQPSTEHLQTSDFSLKPRGTRHKKSIHL